MQSIFEFIEDPTEGEILSNNEDQNQEYEFLHENQLNFGFLKSIDRQAFTDGDVFDVADVEFQFPDTEKKRHQDSNHLIEKLRNIGKGRYHLRIPREPEFPYVINLKTGKKLKLNKDRNQYDAWNIGGVTIAPHKLVGYLCLINSNPYVLDVVDHLNEDKKDFRKSNLKWASNGSNVAKAQKNKKKRNLND